MYLRLLIASLCVLTLSGQTTPPASSPAPADSTDTKPASVSGKTVTSTGQPIKKAVLTLRWVGSPGSGQAMPNPYAASSDAEGKFIFEAVDPGRYTLSADRPGYQRQTYGARRPNGSGTVLALTSGQTMSALNLVLSPQIVISGKVLDSDGDPVAGTQIRVMRSMFYNGKRQIVPTGGAATDENGEYKIQNLGPGKYYISASEPRDLFFGQGLRSAAAAPPPGQPAKQEEAPVMTYYPGVTDPAAATMIELVAGRDRPGTDITLLKSPVFHIRGKASGQVPVDRSQLRATVSPRSSTFMEFMRNASSPIGKDGAFDLSRIPPGSYNLVLINSMGNFKVFGSVPVEIGNHNVDDLTLTVAAPFDLSVQVKTEKVANAAADPAAKPKAASGPLRVSLQPIDGPAINVPNASTTDDDTFILTSVFPGRFRVNVSSLPEGLYLKAIRFGDQDVLESSLTLPPGGGSTPLEITLGANAATLAGSVVNAEGKPAPSAIVTLIPDPPAPDRSDLYKQSNTDQDGRFTIQSIAPGKYHVYAWNDLEPGNQFDPDFLKLYETKGTKLDIAVSAAPQVTLTPIEQ
ncbi:MAG: hypothetical protein JWO80_3847 [Bryobacterales bacterium]|nr:hypothetical protein [Bryobacterales bacterium]